MLSCTLPRGASEGHSDKSMGRGPQEAAGGTIESFIYYTTIIY